MWATWHCIRMHIVRGLRGLILLSWEVYCEINYKGRQTRHWPCQHDLRLVSGRLCLIGRDCVLRLLRRQASMRPSPAAAAAAAASYGRTRLRGCCWQRMEALGARIGSQSQSDAVSETSQADIIVYRPFVYSTSVVVVVVVVGHQSIRQECWHRDKLAVVIARRRKIVNRQSRPQCSVRMRAVFDFVR